MKSPYLCDTEHHSYTLEKRMGIPTCLVDFKTSRFHELVKCQNQTGDG